MANITEPGRELPPNLKFEEYVPPKQLYRGISEHDRNIVSVGCVTGGLWHRLKHVNQFKKLRRE